MCDHILKRPILYLWLHRFKGLTMMRADEAGLLCHITFVGGGGINLHGHAMCHILVQSECVRVGACVLFLYLPGKISCVSKKLPRRKEDYRRGIRLHILLEGFCEPQRRQNADSLDKLLSPCRRWPTDIKIHTCVWMQLTTLRVCICEPIQKHTA